MKSAHFNLNGLKLNVEAKKKRGTFLLLWNKNKEQEEENRSRDEWGLRDWCV